MFMRRHSVGLEIGSKEKNLLLTLHPSQGQLSSMLSFQSSEHVYLKIIALDEVERKPNFVA